MPDFRSPAERQNATHDQRHIGPTTDDAPEHRTGAQFSSLSAWRAKVDRELDLMRKRIGDHMGAEGAGGDYPHPSQRVRSLWFGEGSGRLDSGGIQFIFNPVDDRGLVWTEEPFKNNIVDLETSKPSSRVTSTYDGAQVTTYLSSEFAGGNYSWMVLNSSSGAASVEIVATQDGSGSSGKRIYMTHSANPLVSTGGGESAQYISLDGDWSEKTIATGAITITTSRHIVDTESDAATDDLDTISGGTDGQLLILCAANGARDVVLKDGTGNLKLAGDCTLDNTEDTIMLVKSGSNWLELARSNNGA